MSFLESVRKKEGATKTIISQISLFFLVIGSILIPLFFLPFTQDFINTPKLYLLYGFVLTILFLFLLDMVLSKQVVIRKTFLDIPLLFFIATLIISSAFSVIPNVSLLGKMDVFVMHLAPFVAFMLWFWLLVQFVRNSKDWRFLINSFLVSGCVVGVIFIFQQASVFNFISSSNVFNTISGSNSGFGIFMSIVGVIGLGLLQMKDRSWSSQILPLFSIAISVISLLRLGFTTPLVIFAVGCGLLIVVGTAMLAETRTSILSITFTLFIASILLIFLGVPNFAKIQLPSEVSLSPSTSWHVASNTSLEGIKEFLIGSGPGTFAQDFSKHRPESFNMNSLVWSTRFNTPYSTPFAILAEIGLLGVTGFYALVFIAIGGMFSAWLKTRPSVWEKAKDKVKEKVSDSLPADAIRLEVFVIISAWIALTVGMFISFYNTTLWWSWWFMLAASVVGLSSLIPAFVKEKRISIEVSPQYSLFLSFGMIVAVTLIILIGSLGVRVVLADINFQNAVEAKTLDDKQEYINTAINYRGSYVPYRIAKSRVFLQKAKQAAQNSSSDQQQVANYLSQAVNTTKKATEDEPNGVETWETLASMYLNVQGMVPGANEWAIKALNRAVELEPTNPTLHWKLGGAYTFAGQKDKAEESYKQAIRLKPDYLVAYIHLSQLLASQEKYDQAIGVYQPIFNAVQNSPEAMFNLGRLFFNRQNEGDLDRAERVFKLAIQNSPNYANALYALGLVYEKKGELEKAQNYFDRVREITPDSVNIEQKRQAIQQPTPTTGSTPTEN